MFMKWDWRADLEVNSHRTGVGGAFLAWFLEPSFTFVAWLRLFLFVNEKKTVFRKIIARLIFLHVVKAFACHISNGLISVGRGFKVPHPVGIVLGIGVELGNDVTVFQNVTIGRKPVIAKTNNIRIGDGAVLCAGAVVLGPVSVGAGAVVGANAVVVKDVPEGVTVGGVPAKPLCA